MPNVGMVDNFFHHAHDQMERFPAFFPQLVPHLYAVSINGMKAGGPKILTVGQAQKSGKDPPVVMISYQRFVKCCFGSPCSHLSSLFWR